MEIIEMEKGKCFSAVNRGQRKKSDFYETPYLMTEHYAWYIWVKGWKKEPVIRLIDNQKYVIGKNDI
jgi:hypothetical protein